jgi:hypothetical protein
MKEETAVEVVIEDGIITIPQSAAMIFSGRDQSTKIIDRLRQEALAHVPDLTTKAGRDAVASNAYKVSKSKVVLLKLADTLTAEWKEKTKVVTLEKSFFEKQCDELRDEVRKPLTDWEEAEKLREENERLALKLLADEAAAYADHAIFLRLKELEAKEAELNRIEAERLAKEEAARIEAARIESERIQKEQESQRIKEAEEKARLAAEAEAAQKIAEAEAREIAAKVEAERQKQEAEQTAKLAEQAARLAEERRLAAEVYAQQEQSKAVKAAEEKARFEAQVAESNRLAAEETARQEAAKIAANKEHRRAVNVEALAGLVAAGLSEKQGKDLITALVAGTVKHITINY